MTARTTALALCAHWYDLDDRCETEVAEPGDFCPTHDPFLDPHEDEDLLFEMRREDCE